MRDAAAVAVIVVCKGGCVSRGGDIMHGQYTLSTFVCNNTQNLTILSRNTCDVMPSSS